MWGSSIMANNGSFIPLSIPPMMKPGPGAASNSSMDVVASKSAPGHVVQAPAADTTVDGEAYKEKYNWHTVVDGISKYHIANMCILGPISRDEFISYNIVYKLAFCTRV